MGNSQNNKSNFQEIIDNSDYMICQFEDESKNITPDGDEIYWIYDKSKFQTLNYFECYDNYGQQIGHENAGDSHLDNSYTRDEIANNEDLIELLRQEISPLSEKVNFREIEKDEIIEMLNIWERNYDDDNKNNVEFWETLLDNGFDCGYLVAKTFIATLNQWYENNYEDIIWTVEGFTYWEGGNWETHIIKGSLSYNNEIGDLVELEHNQFYADMLNAWENAEKTKEAYYGWEYECDNYKFTSYNPSYHNEDAQCCIEN